MQGNFPQLFSGYSQPQTQLVLSNGPAHSEPLIDAHNDLDAVSSWLKRYQDSPHTFESARKEAERFLLWLSEQRMGLADVRVDQVVAYQQFLKDPQPAERWVGPAKPRMIDDAPNPEWRPFSKPLADSSIKQACTILFGLFEYLVAARYLNANVWRLVPKKKVSKIKTVERFLPTEARDALFAYVRGLAENEDTDTRKQGIRCRWLVSAFYLSGARRSEVAQARMAHLFRDNTGWWWRITGKGNKTEDVPLTDEFLAQLQVYREAIGLLPMPSPEEKEIPLIGDIYTGRRPISASMVYKLIRQLCEKAAEGVEDPFVANTLKQASPHWLRHTAASDQLNTAGLSLSTVSKNLRHSDISTTSLYLHVDREERHDATQQHKLPETD